MQRQPAEPQRRKGVDRRGATTWCRHRRNLGSFRLTLSGRDPRCRPTESISIGKSGEVEEDKAKAGRNRGFCTYCGPYVQVCTVLCVHSLRKRPWGCLYGLAIWKHGHLKTVLDGVLTSAFSKQIPSHSHTELSLGVSHSSIAPAVDSLIISI